MTIILTGGGSGGHITPLLAVAQELKKVDPKVRLIYIGQRGDRLGDIPGRDPNIDAVYSVRAGKFRRYHGQSFIRQMFDLPTLAKNTRDAWWAFIGLLQAHRLLKRLRPDIIFVKGGFVGVPVGLAAARLHIPYVTHDSDAIPGLANRIIARWAAAHAVALPKEVYNYPQEKTFSVGVPVQSNFRRVDAKLQAEYRQQLGLNNFEKMIFITGGGQGARRVNDAMVACVPKLLKDYDDLVIVHVAGRQHEREITQLYMAKLPEADKERVVVKGYIENLYRYSGAADVIISRAGATNIAEFALQAKACILVPNPYLTAGHQLKNASLLAKSGAVEIVDEITSGVNELEATIRKLLDSATLRHELGQKIYQFANPLAAHDLAELIIHMAHEKR